jgi:hypothetical protein
MILKDALGLLMWGMLLGAAGLLFATRFVRAMLHGISAYDPLTLVSVAGALVYCHDFGSTYAGTSGGQARSV